MKIINFRRIMLRLKTPEHLRIIQSQNFEASYGGAEANVAVSLAMLEDTVSFLTKVPDNPVGMAALKEIRGYGVNTDLVLKGGKRLGIYYFEKGSNIRQTNVVYDREYSALSMAEPEEFCWESLLPDVDIFYFSGVTPAISEKIEIAVTEALKYCKEHNIQVVCDLNYRSKMWSTEKAQSVMKKLMHYVDLCIANDEDLKPQFSLKTERSTKFLPISMLRKTMKFLLSSSRAP